MTALVLSLATLSGCANFSGDGGFDAVRSSVGERIKQQSTWVRTSADADRTRQAAQKILAQPLTADAAVQLALLNNPGLQATYAELGIAEADVVQAGRMRNPGFSFARLRRHDEIEIERAFMFDILGLITMPIRTDLERRRFAFTQSRVAADTLRVAAETRRAYYRALAARESTRYMEQVRDAAEATAELARRMAAAGNFSKLDQAREQAFYAETTAQLARSRQMANAERERLVQMLGLTGDEPSFALPERLPDLPQAPREALDMEKQALANRLDVQAAKTQAENVAASLGLTRATGFINVLELGYQRNSETGQPRQTGYEIEVRLPIFDWGNSRVAKAEFIYMQSVSSAAQAAVRARSEVRETYYSYRTAFDVARHYRDEIVPLRKRISEENLLRYNGMLLSVFELLADARQQIAAVNAYIETLRDFWVADAQLDFAMTGGSLTPASASPSAMSSGAEQVGGGH
jgi:outer membrane protein TolC